MACTLRDIFRDYVEVNDDITFLPQRVATQLNSTHPALTVVELIHTLVDEYRLPQEQTQEITRSTRAYTNHILMPEALETWLAALFEKLLPRHLQVIFEINHRFLEGVARRWPDKNHPLFSLSLIDEHHGKQIRMADLAIVDNHRVDEAAWLHSEPVKKQLVPDFCFTTPEKFIDQTSGVTPRRWVQRANPGLAAFLYRQLGKGWPTDLPLLSGLESLADDTAVIDNIRAIKFANKTALGQLVAQRYGIILDPLTMFDYQVKCIRGYKRQLLNILHVIALYLDIRKTGKTIAPKVHLFTGKAAPGYRMAKLIIQLISTVARKINYDPQIVG